MWTLAEAMKKKSFNREILFLVLIGALLCGCAASRREKQELTVWTDMPEMSSLKSAARRFTLKHHVPVKFERTNLIELKPKYQVAAPVRQGPDIITGPHDWVGPFATAHLIAPITLSPGEQAQYLPVSLKVMSFDGKLYGLPLCVESLGLIYNKKLISKPPETMKELLQKAQELNKGEISGFLFDINDFYITWPFYGGYGAYIFKDTPAGLDPMDIGLDTPGAVEAARFILDLKDKYHLMEQGINKDIANGRFMDNKLAMTLNGPWALADYKKQKISFGFSRIPKLDNGRYPSPLVGVQGIMLNSRTSRPELAMELMKEICSSEGQVDLYLEGGRIPSRYDAQDDPRISQKAVLKDAFLLSPAGGLTFLFCTSYEPNTEVKGILEAAGVGTPMPNIPQFVAVWQPMIEANQLMSMGKLAPEAALKQATERIRKDIKRMMK
jgi:maltose/maltodextrin transport system substrate-binding protein